MMVKLLAIVFLAGASIGGFQFVYRRHIFGTAICAIGFGLAALSVMWAWGFPFPPPPDLRQCQCPVPEGVDVAR